MYFKVPFPRPTDINNSNNNSEISSSGKVALIKKDYDAMLSFRKDRNPQQKNRKNANNVAFFPIVMVDTVMNQLV